MFNSAEELINDIRHGEMVILIDDESRENEGDIIFAAKHTSPEKVNFLLKHARGLICVPMEQERAEYLGLPEMVKSNKDSFGTAFTVSVDASSGVTTGISSRDRSKTIEVLGSRYSAKSDLAAPGHMFPLRAKANGVLDRPGHTEAAVDLVKLAGIEPAVGVICEIMNDDGTMSRKDELAKFAEAHSLKIGTIKDLINYRMSLNEILELKAKARLPVQGLGEWETYAFVNKNTGREHIAVVKKEFDSDEPMLVRIHSECFTGDVLGSERCDCRSQLHRAMKMISDKGRGIIVYLRQEGRGIGLVNKIRAYNLQDKGYDTVEANQLLGFNPDLRNYCEASEILTKLGVKEVNLITNNPSKINGIEEGGIRVVERVPLPPIINTNNKRYLETKKEKFGHQF